MHDPCVASEQEAEACKKKATDGVATCIAWLSDYAHSLCSGAYGGYPLNCDGSAAMSNPKGDFTAVHIDDPVKGTKVTVFTGPGVKICERECMEGRPGESSSSALQVKGELFGLSGSQSYTIPPSAGISQGCIAVGLQAVQQCAEEKAIRDNSAGCEDPGSVPSQFSFNGAGPLPLETTAEYRNRRAFEKRYKIFSGAAELSENQHADVLSVLADAQAEYGRALSESIGRVRKARTVYDETGDAEHKDVVAHREFLRSGGLNSEFAKVEESVYARLARILTDEQLQVFWSEVWPGLYAFAESEPIAMPD